MENITIKEFFVLNVKWIKKKKKLALLTVHSKKENKEIILTLNKRTFKTLVGTWAYLPVPV